MMMEDELFEDNKKMFKKLEEYKDKLIISNNLFMELKKDNLNLSKCLKELQIKYDKIKEDISVINILKKDKNHKNENIKYSKDELFKSIIINNDVNLPCKNFYDKTLKKVDETIKIYNEINKDDNVNKDNYIEVIEWLNIYFKDKNKSRYQKNKIKRCLEILFKYKKQLKFVYFNLSYVAIMSDKKYKEWFNVLDVKINEIIKKLDIIER